MNLILLNYKGYDIVLDTLMSKQERYGNCMFVKIQPDCCYYSNHIQDIMDFIDELVDFDVVTHEAYIAFDSHQDEYLLCETRYKSKCGSKYILKFSDNTVRVSDHSLRFFSLDEPDNVVLSCIDKLKEYEELEKNIKNILTEAKSKLHNKIKEYEIC